MSDRPKVVAVNGSPHVGFGNTSLLLQMLKEALGGHGVDLEEIPLQGQEIGYCVGCAMCLDKGRCWQSDDYRAVSERLLSGDGVILASPVYVFQVTGQMKTFLDRSLPLGHKPRGSWKPGLAVSVSAGYGETEVARYLSGTLRMFGAFSVGELTAIAVAPGGFLGREAIEARAEDLARDLAGAIKDGRRYPATDRDLSFWRFMGGLIAERKAIMADDDRHWRKLGLYDSFEVYIQQEYAEPAGNPEARKAWLRNLISEQRTKKKGEKEMSDQQSSGGGAAAAKTCLELLQLMPKGFNAEAAGDMKAVYQFEVSGDEEFTAHLAIADGQCRFHDGPADSPDVIIKTPAKLWLKISKGETNGQMAFMTGKFKAKGDLGLLMKLNSLFNR